jgi:hypothetical protein
MAAAVRLLHRKIIPTAATRFHCSKDLGFRFPGRLASREGLGKTGAMASPRPLNLVVLRAVLDGVLEAYFIKEVLLAGIGRPIRLMAVEEPAELPLLSDALYLGFGGIAAHYLAQARAQGCRNLGFFHVTDERGDQDRAAYGEADYVLRHYWFPEAMALPHKDSLGVIWVPNGYRGGVGPVAAATMLGIRDRSIWGFFAGVIEARTLSEERRSMARVIAEATLPFVIVETRGFGQGLGPVSYAAYLENARFALVPSGNSPETMRLYDALEAGAIPVALESGFIAAPEALGNPALLLLRSWQDLPAAVAPYLGGGAAAEAALEARRQELQRWWREFKRRQQLRVKDLIDSSFARA